MPFDARILTATNRNLEAQVAKHAFREDLFYRINVVHIDVPPLRHRGNDILELAQLFLDRAAKRMGKSVTSFARPVAERLLTHDWSGNVRELENCMERAVALACFDTITLDDLPLRIRESSKASDEELGIDASNMPTMDTIEMRYIQKVLTATANNKTVAAKILGFDRRTLYRKIKNAS
jgi:two-component system response regulator HydG